MNNASYFGDEFQKFAIQSKHVNGDALAHHMTQANGITNMTRSVIEERPNNFREIDVFSRLMMERIIFLGSGVDDYIANIINAQLLFLESVDSKKPITLYINSPGGGVYAGLSIIDTMNYISAPVHTLCAGMAASMGAVILSAGEKGFRAALRHSRVMIHQPLGGCRGQASDIQITARQIDILKKELYDILSEASGQPYEQIEKDSDRDYWMIAQEAKEYGLIDEVMKRPVA